MDNIVTSNKCYYERYSFIAFFAYRAASDE